MEGISQAKTNLPALRVPEGVCEAVASSRPNPVVGGALGDLQGAGREEEWAQHVDELLEALRVTAEEAVAADEAVETPVDPREAALADAEVDGVAEGVALEDAVHQRLLLDFEAREGVDAFLEEVETAVLLLLHRRRLHRPV